MQGIPVFISQRIRDAPICFFFVYPTWLRCMFVGCWTPPPLSRPERSAQHIFQRYLLRAWGNSWIRWTCQQCCNQHGPWIKWMKILIGFVILTTLATPSFSTTKKCPLSSAKKFMMAFNSCWRWRTNVGTICAPTAVTNRQRVNWPGPSTLSVTILPFLKAFAKTWKNNRSFDLVTSACTVRSRRESAALLKLVYRDFYQPSPPKNQKTDSFLDHGLRRLNSTKTIHPNQSVVRLSPNWYSILTQFIDNANIL